MFWAILGILTKLVNLEIMAVWEGIGKHPLDTLEHLKNGKQRENTWPPEPRICLDAAIWRGGDMAWPVKKRHLRKLPAYIWTSHQSRVPVIEGNGQHRQSCSCNFQKICVGG